jgi:hypothetical protein
LRLAPFASIPVAIVAATIGQRVAAGEQGAREGGYGGDAEEQLHQP